MKPTTAQRGITGFLVLLIILCSIPVSAFAQYGWQWQNPNPQGSDLLAVATVSENVAVAVGGYGTIQRTTDAGATWTEQRSGTTDWLRGVSFPDDRNGTAVGDRGRILHTTDGGVTWAASRCR